MLPRGYVPPNPAELLGSGSMREVIATLRKRYDWVLIDAPPDVHAEGASQQGLPAGASVESIRTS